MKIEKSYLRPKPAAFFGFFILGIIAFLSIGTIIENFDSTQPFEFKFDSLLKYILFALVNATGLTIGTRRLQVKISDTANFKNIKEGVLEFLLDHGVKIKETTETQMTLESIKTFNKMLNDWFGTEVISVKGLENKLIVEGPFRLIDKLESYVDSKLRVGLGQRK